MKYLEKSLDPLLIGPWQIGSVEAVVDAYGGFFFADPPASFTLTDDGQTLTRTTLNPPQIFARITGDPTLITGTWMRSYTSGDYNVVEDVYFRANGTFTWHATYDGIPDVDYAGMYEVTGNLLKLSERRGTIKTFAPNILLLIEPTRPTLAPMR